MRRPGRPLREGGRRRGPAVLFRTFLENPAAFVAERNQRLAEESTAVAERLLSGRERAPRGGALGRVPDGRLHAGRPRRADAPPDRGGARRTAREAARQRAHPRAGGGAEEGSRQPRAPPAAREALPPRARLPEPHALLPEAAGPRAARPVHAGTDRLASLGRRADTRIRDARRASRRGRDAAHGPGHPARGDEPRGPSRRGPRRRRARRARRVVGEAGSAPPVGRAPAGSRGGAGPGRRAGPPGRGGDVALERVLERGALLERESGAAAALAFYEDAAPGRREPSRAPSSFRRSPTSPSGRRTSRARSRPSTALLEIPASRGEALLRKGDVLESLGQGDAAERVFEEAARASDPDVSVRATLRLARGAERAQNALRATTLYEEILLKAPGLLARGPGAPRPRGALRSRGTPLGRAAALRGSPEERRRPRATPTRPPRPA